MSFKTTTLDEYITVQGGYAYKSADFVKSSPYSVLRIKNIGFGNIQYEDTAYISKELAESTLDWKVRQGDLLISMTGSNFNAPNSLVGRVGRVWDEKPAWINQRVGRIRPKSKHLISIDFVYYLLSQKEVQYFLVANSTGGGNQANISPKIIGLVPCPKIDFATSKKIAEFLITLDEKIIKNNQINQTLEAMAQAIFKSWFVDFDPVHAKAKAKLVGSSDEEINLAAMRVISSKTDAELEEMAKNSPTEYKTLQATASHFPDEFEKSELGMIPKGWKVSNFKSWCDIKRGKNITKAKVTDGDIPVVAGGIEPAYYHNKHNVEGPVITISASGANAGYINLYFQNIWSSDSSYIDQNSTTYFYTSYVCLKYYQDVIFSMQTGAAQPHIYPKDFERLNIVLPDNNVLLKMEECISCFFLQISHNKSENVSLIGIRDSLLPKLLSGELEI